MSDLGSLNSVTVSTYIVIVFEILIVSCILYVFLGVSLANSHYLYSFNYISICFNIDLTAKCFVLLLYEVNFFFS